MSAESRIRPRVTALATRATEISLEEYQDLRMNSWEFEHLVPNLTKEALAYAVENCLKNCYVSRARPSITYEAALVCLYAPELLKRLKREPPR